MPRCQAAFLRHGPASSRSWSAEPDDAYAQVLPILRRLGSPSHIGANGHGLVLKLAINISLAVQMLAFAEGLVLAARSGLDPELAGGVMAQSAIGSPMLQIREPLDRKSTRLNSSHSSISYAVF